MTRAETIRAALRRGSTLAEVRAALDLLAEEVARACAVCRDPDGVRCCEFGRDR